MDKEGDLSEALFFNTLDTFLSLWIHIERYEITWTWLFLFDPGEKK